jgi:hypothetical protein
MTDAGHNRLAALAVEIKQAHADTLHTARLAAEHAIDCGKLLIEAKELVPHGQWLPWLKANARMSERTAQLYMKVAQSGVKSAMVAVLGLRAAAEAVVLHYDPFADCDAVGRREWLLYMLFGVPEDSVCWLLRHGFKTVGEWYGAAGAGFRQRIGLKPIADDAEIAWTVFLIEHQDLDEAAILERIAALPRQTPSTGAKRRLRRRAA